MGSARLIMLAVAVAVAVAVVTVEGNYSIVSGGQRAAKGDASGVRASGGELRQEAMEKAGTVGGWVKDKVKKGLGFNQQQQQPQRFKPAAVAAEEGAMEYATDTAGEAKETAQEITKEAVEKAQDVKDKAQQQAPEASEKAEEVKEKAQKQMKAAVQKAKEAQETMAQKVQEAKKAASQKAKDAKDEASRWAKMVAEEGAEVGEKSGWAKEKIKGGYEATKKKASDALHGAKEKIVGSPQCDEL
ncbi:hypothetical protein Cgig2_025109 [Carnegiea gigantea]|uniref:Late embryogenesis abundant protein n=1 Tax=Carnegiea gigantea TaxID=171969 RepID=A0A9Q1QAS9_9CARY|nr:hypothetical protein Cgig2_033739 [Carnegiea gigantea]KAJ8444108.1 hypothetical protein Cgig2_025109 [Carnegiea gigantea]